MLGLEAAKKGFVSQKCSYCELAICINFLLLILFSHNLYNDHAFYWCVEFFRELD